MLQRKRQQRTSLVAENLLELVLRGTGSYGCVFDPSDAIKCKTAKKTNEIRRLKKSMDVVYKITGYNEKHLRNELSVTKAITRRVELAERLLFRLQKPKEKQEKTLLELMTKTKKFWQEHLDDRVIRNLYVLELGRCRGSENLLPQLNEFNNRNKRRPDNTCRFIKKVQTEKLPLYLQVFEKIHCDLKHFVKHHPGKLTFCWLHKELVRMLAALAIIHPYAVHHDIKWDNIYIRLISGRAHMALGDWGLADTPLLHAVGAPFYAPPSRRGSAGFSPPDMWVLDYRISVGKDGFGRRKYATFNDIRENEMDRMIYRDTKLEWRKHLQERLERVAAKPSGPSSVPQIWNKRIHGCYELVRRYAKKHKGDTAMPFPEQEVEDWRENQSGTPENFSYITHDVFSLGVVFAGLIDTAAEHLEDTHFVALCAMIEPMLRINIPHRADLRKRCSAQEALYMVFKTVWGGKPQTKKNK